MTTWPHPEEFLKRCFPVLYNFNFIAIDGQKVVYSAYHPKHGQIALKIISASNTPERFYREIAAIQSINAEQVPLVIEHGCMPAPFSNQFWMTEQWIPGFTLRAHLALGRIPDNLILLIATSVLAVLVKAEEKHIVHRDIKPENIIISPDGSRCWLIDFGIARHLDKTSLTCQVMPSTIGYAPIEQIEALKHQIDTRSDLFSLGVTLYECVEGVNPYIHGASDAIEVIERITTTQLPIISRELGGSAEFGELLHTMSKMHRTHRIRTASEAMKWLDEINAGGNQ